MKEEDENGVVVHAMVEKQVNVFNESITHNFILKAISSSYGVVFQVWVVITLICGGHVVTIAQNSHIVISELKL